MEMQSQSYPRTVDYWRQIHFLTNLYSVIVEAATVKVNEDKILIIFTSLHSTDLSN